MFVVVVAFVPFKEFYRFFRFTKNCVFDGRTDVIRTNEAAQQQQQQQNSRRATGNVLVVTFVSNLFCNYNH